MLITIGQLAKKVGLRTSTLRFYEAEGLLLPNGRSESGYRLYAETAVSTLQLIQRAQRLGFSLAEIHAFLKTWESGNLSDEAVIDTAEKRYMALEQQITDRLIQQHELALFLQDLKQRQGQQENGAASAAFDAMLARVCANPMPHPPANSLLSWLMEHTSCALNSSEGHTILEKLQGQHVHIWQENDAYHILIVSAETAVHDAVQALAQLESRCKTHAQQTTKLLYNDEGFQLIVQGKNAFIFARLFLALEQHA